MSSLVSVIIATYNSSPFIIETLESVLQQTWKDIDLIITDDSSEDDTVGKCVSWLKKNGERFANSEILISDINTGVSSNANRGLSVAKGNWIKFLGADDTLLPNCIEDNMLWIASHPEIRVLFSTIIVYKDNFEPENLIETTPGDPFIWNGIMANGRSADSQFRMLLLYDRIHFTPSAFLHRDTLISVGGFDERFRLLEDYPLWLNLTKNGYKLFFMDKVTVNYRRHSKAINNSGLKYLINPNYFRSEDFRIVYTYPNLPAEIRLNQQLDWYISQIFRFNWLNKNTKPNKFLLTLLTVYMNPLRCYIFLKKYFFKNLKNNEFYI